MAKEKPDLGGGEVKDIERSWICPRLNHQNLSRYPAFLSLTAKAPAFMSF